MIELLKVVASVVLFFGGSLLVSYGVVSLIAARRQRLDLDEGVSVRLIGPGGSYRCHFLGFRGEDLAFSSPIQADRYVPVRVGERLYVQAPGKDCMLSFRCTVIARDGDAHELRLTAPDYVRRSQRRSEPRMTDLTGEDALVDGEPATLVDLSAAGACLLSRRRSEPGRRVRVVLPKGELDTIGWVLEATPSEVGVYQGYKTRIQFTEPLAGLSRR
jgi:hypothetical protein